MNRTTKDRPDLFEGTANLPPLTPPDWFQPACEQLHLSFDAGDTERLGRFLNILLTVNERTNLTAIKAPDDAWRKHILDALTLIPYLAAIDADRPNPDRRQQPLQVADIGSGAGLPAIPLAACLPDIAFAAVDATAKKTAFIEHAAKALHLTNIATITDRAENLGRSPEHRANFDAVTARAVGPVAVLAELAVPLLKNNAIALLVKGEKADQELHDAKKALHALHARHEATDTTPTGRVVVISKQRPTPHAYPRKPGEPKRAPLGA